MSLNTWSTWLINKQYSNLQLQYLCWLGTICRNMFHCMNKKNIGKTVKRGWNSRTLSSMQWVYLVCSTHSAPPQGCSLVTFQEFLHQYWIGYKLKNNTFSIHWWMSTPPFLSICPSPIYNSWFLASGTISLLHCRQSCTHKSALKKTFRRILTVSVTFSSSDIQ